MKKTEMDIWLKSAVNEVTKTGIAKDIHVDEIITLNVNSAKALLYDSLAVFNKTCKMADEYEFKDLQLYLHIDLKSELNTLQGVCKDLNTLIDSIDLQGMPEIILYKPIPTIDIPEMEFYRSILPFKIEDNKMEDKIKVFYKEYRSYEDIINNDFFNRELNFIYSPLLLRKNQR